MKEAKTRISYFGEISKGNNTCSFAHNKIENYKFLTWDDSAQMMEIKTNIWERIWELAAPKFNVLFT